MNRAISALKPHFSALQRRVAGYLSGIGWAERIGWGAYYFLGIWITIAMTGFALDWRGLKTLPDTYMYTGMQWFEGKISSVRTSGWGKFKSYLFMVNGSGAEVALPAGIASGAWTHDKMPTVNPDLMSLGSWVKVGTAAGRPIVVAFFAQAPNGQLMAVLPHDVGAARYRWAIHNADSLSNEILFEAMLVIPSFIAAQLGFVFYRRRRNRSPATVKPAIRMTA